MAAPQALSGRFGLLLFLFLWRNVEEVLFPPLSYQQNQIDKDDEDNPADQDKVGLHEIDDCRILHRDLT